MNCGFFDDSWELPCACLQYFKDVKFLPKVIAKYISLARNAFAVIIGIVLAYCLTDSDGNGPFKLTGDIEPGLPPFKLPPFSTTVDGEELNFKDMINQLGFSIVSIALISILDTVTMAKAFCEYIFFYDFNYNFFFFFLTC